MYLVSIILRKQILPDVPRYEGVFPESGRIVDYVVRINMFCGNLDNSSSWTGWPVSLGRGGWNSSGEG